MHPILSHPRRLLSYSFAVMLLGIVLAFLLVELYAVSWSQALIFALPAMQLYGFILTSAYYVCRSLPLHQRTAWRVVMIFSSAAQLSSLAWVVLCLVWNNIIGDITDPMGNVVLNRQFLIVLFIGGVLLYLVSLLAHDVFIAFDNVRAAERQQATSQLLARDAELQVLRSQINPHFLFNSLNSISALTSIDAAAARSMAIGLGDFYRKTLALATRQQISLGEEIELCEHFVAIEKIRFGEKLQINWCVEPITIAAQVPAMFLQPLLENAIKHGICNCADGGVIVVSSSVRDARLFIVITNPVDAEPSLAKGSATGLKNLKARLQNVYQELARVNWREADGQFFVEIIIPYSIA